MTFRYQFGGIAILSDIPFPRLREAAADAPARSTIQVRRGTGPVPPEESCTYAFIGRFGMRLGTSGDRWRVQIPEGVALVSRDGRDVTLVIDGEDETFFKDLFCRRVLPRITKLHGAATYHAGSLVRDGRGVLLLGHSGAGKSTMTVGLGLAAGWHVLGDDMAMVWHDDDRWLIEPAGPDVAIWPQSSSGFDLPDDALKPLRGYAGKSAFRTPALPDTHGWEAPLKGVFFVERIACPAPVAVPLARGPAVKLAMEQMVLFDPSGSGTPERIHSLTELNTMLGEVPAFSLRYPPVYGIYDAISDVIEGALDGKAGT